MSYTSNRILLIILSAGGLLFCLLRDSRLEKQYTGDLRNRIVGARLQKAGHAPYFYKWKQADGIRYYDPQNFDSFRVSNMTATPFLHQLLYPVAGLSQRSISHLWLAAEYLLLLLAFLLAMSFTKNRTQQWVVAAMALLFACTSAWKTHIAAGQYYLVIPALCMLFYYLANRKRSLPVYLLAGIVAGCLVLIRPNTLLFLLPFLLLRNTGRIKTKLFFIVGLASMFLFAFAGSNSRAYWNDFRQSMEEQVKIHQQLHPSLQSNEPDPGFRTWEGWDKTQIEKDAALHPFKATSEHANVFVIVNHLSGTSLPLWVLAGITVLATLFLLFLFYKRTVTGQEYPLLPAALLGYGLYMISDFCSPFYRFEYNAVQWLFPLLLIAVHYSPHYKKINAALFIGLLLNVLDIHAIPFEHTAGEYLILSAVLILAFVYKQTGYGAEERNALLIKNQ